MQKIEELPLSKNERRSMENKRKLTEAMEDIMQKYDYNTVTIRNICKVSGVSYGSFYNLFDSKEAFLRYYLTSDFSDFMEEYYKDNEEFEKLSLKEKSIDGFICCAHYNIEKGLNFISAFYSPNNYSLYPLKEEEEGEHSFSPLTDMAKKYLEEARKEGEISAQTDITEAANMFCYIFNGITFNWCISREGFDIVKEVKRILKNYIRGII